MLRAILIDENHIDVRVAKHLPEAEYRAMRRTLNEPRFQKE
jgi:hypothetical protein